MKLFNNGHFEGERALYQLEDAKIVDCLFDNGESPLKECENLEVIKTTFAWKYPLWYSHHFKVEDCLFKVDARAGVWYSDDFSFKDCVFDSPKMFRRSKNFTLENISFNDAKEMLYNCENVTLVNVKANDAPYFAFRSKGLKIDRLEIVGDYAFDSCEDLYISNSFLHTKDAFWNCKNIVIENSTIEGEYFGWNSINMTLRNCIVKSHQGFCYIKDLVVENCQVIDSDLTFEYCENISANITSIIDSVKNPISGHIKAYGIKEVVRDGNPDMDPKNTLIEVLGEDGQYHEV